MSTTIHVGDALSVLRTLPSASVHMCVTSPPYYGLRSYDACACAGEGRTEVAEDGRGDRHTAGGAIAFHRPGKPDPDCDKCGGTGRDSALSAAQLGLEATPELWVAAMVEVFAEVRRVLRPDGTLWLNIGDSYAGSGKGQPGVDGFQSPASEVKYPGLERDFHNVYHGITDNKTRPRWPKWPDIKPKDLIGAPWMLAFALRADGWYLRSEIIWHKPNPMPESVTDRPTKAHEQLFLLSKSRTYYYDADAIREPHVDPLRWSKPATEAYGGGRRPGSEHDDYIIGWRKSEEAGNPAGRNKRSVWTVATEAFPESHFATYPTALIEPCIKAGCPAGGTVLDPFGGAGTTGLVAERLGRNALLIELNPAYAEMAQRRINGEAPMFSDVSVA